MSTNGHVKRVHKNCALKHCQICCGGLFVCDICGCGEGTLTTDCSGEPVSPEDQDLIMAGKIDFLDGDWVRL